MNPYAIDSLGTDAADAASLRARLVAWHDAMVAHQRPADTDRITRCDGDCPHAEARSLWHDAIETFGDGADQLGFLRRHGAPARHLPLHDRDVPAGVQSSPS